MAESKRVQRLALHSDPIRSSSLRLGPATDVTQLAAGEHLAPSVVLCLGKKDLVASPSAIDPYPIRPNPWAKEKTMMSMLPITEMERRRIRRASVARADAFEAATKKVQGKQPLS